MLFGRLLAGQANSGHMVRTFPAACKPVCDVVQPVLRSSNNGILLTFPSSKSKKTLGDHAFMFVAPKLWNALPIDMRTTNTVESFKCKLKTYLFKGAFCYNFILYFLFYEK